jgi:hypothetical protein
MGCGTARWQRGEARLQATAYLRAPSPRCPPSSPSGPQKRQDGRRSRSRSRSRSPRRARSRSPARWRGSPLRSPPEMPESWRGLGSGSGRGGDDGGDAKGGPANGRGALEDEARAWSEDGSPANDRCSSGRVRPAPARRHPSSAHTPLPGPRSVKRLGAGRGGRQDLKCLTKATLRRAQASGESGGGQRPQVSSAVCGR